MKIWTSGRRSYRKMRFKDCDVYILYFTSSNAMMVTSRKVCWLSWYADYVGKTEFEAIIGTWEMGRHIVKHWRR